MVGKWRYRDRECGINSIDVQPFKQKLILDFRLKAADSFSPWHPEMITCSSDIRLPNNPG